MPTIQTGSNRGSSERAFQFIMDWMGILLRLSALAVVLLYGYLLYGLFAGAVGQWEQVNNAAEHARLVENVQMAVRYLNLAVGVLLISSCVLYYDEEAIGYTFIAGSIVLYYGVPFLFETFFYGQVSHWEQTRNIAALAIFKQFRTAALMLAVPGVILVVRDLILRLVDHTGRHRDEFSAMEYGGSVREEAPPSAPLIGVMAKCWQLSFCRDAIRKQCPIYHARTRCWRERVGCMCEENVIRHAMDVLINKQDIRTDASPLARDDATKGPLNFDGDLGGGDDSDKTEEMAPQPWAQPAVATPVVPPKNVKIPHNPNLPMSVKRERCRNCVIYNEHQRLKYQFVAPLFVIGVPALLIWKIDAITGGLNSTLHTVDRMMEKLSLAQNPAGISIASSLTSTNVIAQYLIIGCLIVIVTTMALRLVEQCIFGWKI